MVISLMVAAARNSVIGAYGTLPWRLPDESAYFRKTIKDHPVIMGRKTYEITGKDPLPGTVNLVITRDPNYPVVKGFRLASSLGEALSLPEVKAAKEVFIIGGQQIFEQAMPLADKLYLTIVDAEVEGDAVFKYDPNEWQIVSSQKHPADAKHKYSFEMTIQDRITKKES